MEAYKSATAAPKIGTFKASDNLSDFAIERLCGEIIIIDNTPYMYKQAYTKAANIFSKFGFHKTTVDEIARASHKAKGSVYYHFESKEDLFQKVVDKEFQTLRTELIEAIDNGNNAKEKLVNYITVRMKTLNELINFLRISVFLLATSKFL